MAAPALAADLPVKAPPPVYLPPMFNWSGLYIGANGGWGQNDNCLDIATAAGAVLVDGCRDRSGGIVGGQIGYRWQMPNNHFVFGIEAQGDWADLSSSRVSVVDPAVTFGTKLDGLGLFSGQISFAWDTWLWYAKGGAAVTSNNLTVLSTATGIGLASASTTRWGGVVGTGFEYAFAPNWSVGFERCDHSCRPAVDMVTIRFNYRFGGYGGPVVARY
jgi:outer membrane immunogenic protein